MVSSLIALDHSGVSCSAQHTVSNWWAWDRFDDRNVASSTRVGNSPSGSRIEASGSADSA